MLNDYRQGYAVMSSDLKAIAFESENIEDCKKYCRNGDVIAKRIPNVCGFSVRIVWYEFHTPFNFKYKYYNILWLHWSWHKEYLHKTGEIVYKSDLWN